MCVCVCVFHLKIKSFHQATSYSCLIVSAFALLCKPSCHITRLSLSFDKYNNAIVQHLYAIVQHLLLDFIQTGVSYLQLQFDSTMYLLGDHNHSTLSKWMGMCRGTFLTMVQTRFLYVLSIVHVRDFVLIIKLNGCTTNLQERVVACMVTHKHAVGHLRILSL